MEVITTAAKMQNFRANLRGTVGFVPTMGALHEGHMSLIETSLKECDHTIVSIYVNPTQFLPGEDLERYPRQLEKDMQTCKEAGVDAVFAPNNLYESDEVGIKAPTIKGYVLEGHFRPGHFEGVLQVVLKLLGITQAHRAYFGRKDAQQYLLLRQMAKDFFLPVRIIGLPTLRDSDGLAKSSRNVYLSASERKRALSIYRALHKAADLLEQGYDPKEAQKEAKTLLDLDKIHYFTICDRDLNPLPRYEKDNTLILAAGFIGGTRLIDNLWL